MGCGERLCIGFFYFLIAISFPFSIWFCFHTIKEYERIIIYRLGHLKKQKPLGPGMIFILPCVDKFFILDLRVVTFDVPPQEILTKDSVTIYVEAVVYFKISDPLLAVQCVTNYNHSTRILAATTLRNVLGSKQLTHVLSEKEAIANEIYTILDEATIHWGVFVTNVEIKDVSLPISMQRAMAAEGEASRDATANVIFAEGELEAAALLKEASDTIGADNNTALQLRYLHTLTQVAVERNTTVLFPIPSQLIKKLCNSEEPNLPIMKTKASGTSEIDLPSMITTASGPDMDCRKQRK